MSDNLLSKSSRMLNIPAISHLEYLEESQSTISTRKLQAFVSVIREECRDTAMVLREAWDDIKKLQAENEALRARLAHHEIKDDDLEFLTNVDLMP